MTRNERREKGKKNEEETKSRPTKKVSHITNAKMSLRRTRTRGGEGEGEEKETDDDEAGGVLLLRM